MKGKVRVGKGTGAFETQDPPPGGGGGKQAGYPTLIAKTGTASKPAKGDGSSKTKGGSKGSKT